MALNATHDPDRRSWLPSANEPGTDFPIQNLPLGVFTVGASAPAIGVAIGGRILNLHATHAAGLLSPLPAQVAEACTADTLNALMALGPVPASQLRSLLSDLLRAGHAETERHRQALTPHLVPMAEATMRVPARIGDYSDFYASIHHATNVGRLFRPDNPLLPNYKYVPIGYHGRASSIVVSGAPVRRPHGQVPDPPGAPPPRFAPTRSLDYELEVGFYVGSGNALGEPIPIADAPAHIFGLSLVNDWSARDVQAWEYQPLGPFLAKNFATTLSPWVVTSEALEPFRTAAFARPDGDPQPLPYLLSEEDQRRGAFDLTLEVYLSTARMRDAGSSAVRLSRGNLRDLYWTPAQLLTHHASNGCNLQPGDLLASGTVSGAEKDSRGCLLELTQRGAEPLQLPSGETRRFLEDGDEITLSGYCEREGFARIGFGQCAGRIVPA